MNKKLQLIPVMLCFFAMGFVDLVGIASNYVQSDLGLSDSAANIFPSLVFFWFLIFSVPTGMLMNKIGRKNTVLLSLAITILSLILPIFGESYALMLAAFSLLGIGNAIMQTSLNPLIANIVKGDGLASTITFGQFVKAIASFMAPYIAMWGATAALPSFGLGWRLLFPVYGIIGIVAALLLAGTSIERETVSEKASGFADCLKLLGKPFVLFSFLSIMCHVGIDVGTNTTAPKLLMERVGMTLTQAGFATFILSKFSHKKFFLLNVILMAAAMCLMFFGGTKAILYTAIVMIGLANSNLFSIVFSQALLAVPDKQNEVSGLMIMGLFGGTIFPLLMGFASDAVGQAGAVAVMFIGALYLLYYSSLIRK